MPGRGELFLFGLVLSSLEIRIGEATLRVGVLEEWFPLVKSALELRNETIEIFEAKIGESRSSYDRLDKIHKMLDSLDVHVVIGTYDMHVCICAEALSIPYIGMTGGGRKDQQYFVQMEPEIKKSAEAFLEIAKAYKWLKLSVFYDNDNGMKVLEKLMTNHTISVRAWKLPKRASRKRVRESLVSMRKVLVEQSVVLCNRENTDLILDEARNLAMMSTPPYSWLFYDPGDEMRKVFMKYRDIATNFTIVSMLPFHNDIDAKDKSKFQFGLAMDVLKLLSSAYDTVLATAGNPDIVLDDATIRHQINRAVRINNDVGLTGGLSFDLHGRRDNYTLTLTSVLDTTQQLLGRWLSQTDSIFVPRLQFYDKVNATGFNTVFPLKGRTAKVVMIQERPFTMLKRDHMLRRGNDKFEGFAVDLIDEVAKMLEFNYEIYLVHDGKFGSKMDNGEWNGMIGELLAGNATMSVAPLSINSQREEAVDFTKPFKTRYITVVMRVPKQKRSYFEFLNPLSPKVWICTLCAFVVVSIVLYSLERVGRRKNTEGLPITIRESFWFIFGSLLQGNTDSTPSTVPGRILTSAWWFFALILISSYTANLAAFLTVKKINTPIKSVTDLAQQTSIKYGTVKDSGVMSFFKHTTIEHFTKMWAHMSEIEPDSMVANTSEGYDKVKKGGYAFFWDTTVNKYQTIVDCDLMEIGPAFDPKGFGIGVPPGATYREELSLAILKLSDRGKLHELETRWWDNSRCPDLTKATTDETSELQIENVAGVFFILVGGIVLAAIVCVGEYFGNAMVKASKLEQNRKKVDRNGYGSEAFL